MDFTRRILDEHASVSTYDIDTAADMIANTTNIGLGVVAHVVASHHITYIVHGEKAAACTICDAPAIEDEVFSQLMALASSRLKALPRPHDAESDTAIG